MNQVSLWQARRARDEGIERTRSKNSDWLIEALSLLPRMKAEHREATGEGMRIWLLSNGLKPPTSPNAWGSLTRTAMKRGVIRDTERVTQMFTEKSHARRTPIWEIV